jgi:hypothetical protein
MVDPIDEPIEAIGPSGPADPPLMSVALEASHCRTPSASGMEDFRNATA